MRKIYVVVFVLLQYSVPAQKLPDSFTGGKYVTVNGAKLWIVVAGQGDPLFIVPGARGAHISVTGLLIHWRRITRSFILMHLGGGTVILQKTLKNIHLPVI